MPEANFILLGTDSPYGIPTLVQVLGPPCGYGWVAGRGTTPLPFPVIALVKGAG